MARDGAYWKKRFEILEDASNKYGQDCFRQIEPAFDKAEREIEKEINSWYGRFAKNNQITIDEAKKLLNSKELKEFKWDVQEYIKYGHENGINQLWMKELENASSRFHVSRLEALKVRTQHAAEVAFGNELDAVDSMARKVYSEDYYHSIFEMQKGFNLGWEIGQIDERKLDKIITKPWAADGKNFSDRIWEQKNQLVNELHQQLTRTCVLGKAPDDAINAIAKKFNVSKNQAGRLVMTEQAYFHSVAQKDAFNELDVEEFEVVATLDSHTSDVCQEMDGKHFPMKEYEPGVTAPPFHVWCRSVTVPYFEDNFTGERAARDADGNTYYVPDNMTYKDWKKSMVDGDTRGMKVSMSKEADIDWLPKGTNITDKQYKKLRDYAETKGIRLSGFRKSDVDIDLTKEFINDASRMLDEYPELKGTSKKPFTFVLSSNMNPNDFAETTPGVTHIIKLNADAMRDKTKLVEEYKKLADIGWFVKGTDYHSIIYHEIGHIIGDKYKIDGFGIAKSISQLSGDDEVFDYVEENLSEYSISQLDGSEIISEVFSAYKSGIEKDFILTFIKMCDIL